MKDSVTDEIRNALMESAAWDRMDIAPKFLNEDDEKEASEEEAEESEEESEEGSEEEVSDEAEAVEEEYSNLELLHMLLSEMSDDDLLEHIGEVLEVIDEAADVIEEELEEEEA